MRIVSTQYRSLIKINNRKFLYYEKDGEWKWRHCVFGDNVGRFASKKSAEQSTDHFNNLRCSIWSNVVKNFSIWCDAHSELH